MTAKSRNRNFDLVILGSGSTAFAAALRAQEMGKSVVMTEERTVGGTCVNRGCLPSKNLIEAARLVHEARHPRYPGISPARAQIDFRQLIAQKDVVIHEFRAKKYESLVGGKIEIVKGHAEFLDAHTIAVDSQRLIGDKILIATGSRPVMPTIEGLDETPFLTSDLLTSEEPIEMTELPRSLMIVGGGYIALELGQMFQRFGAQVTIFERSGQLLPRGYEPEIGQTIRQILEAEGIEVVTDATVHSVRKSKAAVVADVNIGGRRREFRAAKLLIAAGRRPNTDHIAIHNAGVAVRENGQVIVNEYLQTNVPHIYAAGDVIGQEAHSQMATPVGSKDGGIAAHNALSSDPPQPADHRVIPRAIFTDPPIAVVGMTEEEAVAAGHPCWCNWIPMSLVPRAGAIHDTRGLIKMVADADSDEVLGVQMVGHSASEVIHEAAMAMRFRARARLD